MCRYCKELLEKVTVCGGRWLVTQSGEVICSGVQADSVGSVVTCFEQK